MQKFTNTFIFIPIVYNYVIMIIKLALYIFFNSH
jgi:hypothetical protein